MAARLTDWNETWSLAVVFGIASVPWTYAFVAGLGLPLWPSFVAAATYYTTDRGPDGFARGVLGNLAGIAYAAGTVAVVDGALGGGVLALSLVVGAAMFLASLHPFVEPVSFAPAAFFGYATLFGVHAAGTGAVVPGLAGEAVAAGLAMLIGSAIGLGTDAVSDRFAPTRRPSIDR
jgi:hypothetical protein